MEPLSLGASSFTPQQVLDVWQTHKKARSRMIPSSQFHCEGIKKINGELKIYMATSILDFKPDNHIPIEDFCIDLFKRALQTDNHFISLDDLLSKLVECSFRIDDDTSYPDHVATQRAIDLLIRLPAFPPPISTAGLDFRHFNPGYTNTTTSYDTEEARPDTSAGIDWADLNTVSSVSKIIIAMALIISYGGREVPRPANLRRLIDTLAGLLKTASQMSDKAEGHESTNAWYVLRSYLWTCWQRASMLYFWYVMTALTLIYLAPYFPSSN